MKLLSLKLDCLSIEPKEDDDPPQLPTASPRLILHQPEAMESHARIKFKAFGGGRKNSRLESLPPEIRHHFLSVLPLGDLNRMIHASPVYLQQFMLGRKALVLSALEVTLRAATVDACAVYRSSPLGFADSRSRSNVEEFLEAYQERRSDAAYSILTEALTENEATHLAIFHASVVQPLVQRYTLWAMTNLANKADTGHVNRTRPSKTEELRLMRGMYRFQLLCNLFGKGQYQSFLSPRLGLRSEDILDLFVSLFEPWEIEEICCIHTFASEKYRQIFHDVADDVYVKNFNIDGDRISSPQGTYVLHNAAHHDRLLKGTISRGLQLLHTVFFLIRDRKHLVSTIQGRISYPTGAFLADAMGDSALYSRRRRKPSERDEKEMQRDPLPFQGDRDPLSILDEAHPPLSWTIMWGGTYSNVYGFYIGDKIRHWGYIFWDAVRLERSGAKGVLARQWAQDWGGSDARDDML